MICPFQRPFPISIFLFHYSISTTIYRCLSMILYNVCFIYANESHHFLAIFQFRDKYHIQGFLFLLYSN